MAKTRLTPGESEDNARRSADLAGTMRRPITPTIKAYRDGSITASELQTPIDIRSREQREWDGRHETARIKLNLKMEGILARRMFEDHYPSAGEFRQRIFAAERMDPSIPNLLTTARANEEVAKFMEGKGVIEPAFIVLGDNQTRGNLKRLEAAYVSAGVDAPFEQKRKAVEEELARILGAE